MYTCVLMLNCWLLLRNIDKFYIEPLFKPEMPPERYVYQTVRDNLSLRCPRVDSAGRSPSRLTSDTELAKRTVEHKNGGLERRSAERRTPRGLKNGNTEQTEKRIEGLLSPQESARPSTKIQLMARVP